MRSRSVVAILVLVALLAAAPASAGPDITAGAGSLPGGGYAFELKGETPHWYTPELHAKVVAAGKQGRSVPIPDGAELPQSGLLFTGIRPGSWMLFPSWCTMNFVFGDGSLASAPASARSSDDSLKPKGEKANPGKKRTSSGGGGLYIGSAGHCGEVGDEVTIVGAPGVLMNIGTVVKSVDNGVGDDFLLVQIDPEWYDETNPSMAHFGGPTGARAPAIGDPVVHSGHGLAIGTGGTPRAGLVAWLGDGDEANAYGWDGEAINGDSGSAVRHLEGGAVGNLTHLVVGTNYLPAFIAGTTIDRMLQIAGQPLVTAPAVPDPLP
jgi:hypothetical protein